MMIILLLLLPTLVLGDDTSTIDWKLCEEFNKVIECKCLLNSELVLPGIQESLDAQQRADKVAPCSKIGIQHKFFSADAELIQIQFTDTESSVLGDEPRVMIVDTTLGKEQFGCKRNKDTGRIELDGDPDVLEEYQISLFEDRSRMKPNDVICAIKIDYAYKYKVIDQALKVFFSTEKSYKITIPDDLYKPAKEVPEKNVYPIKCDPYSFNDLTYSNEYHVKPIWGRDSATLNCEKHQSDEHTYTMRYELKDKEKGDGKEEGTVMDKLECKDDAGDFYYELYESDPNNQPPPVPKKILIPEKYTFYCTTNYNEVCENPTAACQPNGNLECPKFNNGKKIKGTPSSLTCDKKWYIDEKYYELENEPECRRNEEMNDNTAIFYAKLPSGNEVTIGADARCYKYYDCSVKSNLDLPGAKDQAAGEGIDKSDPMVLKCATPSKVLTVRNAAANVFWNTTSSFECDKSDGIWRNGTIALPSGTLITCPDPPIQPVETAAAAMSDNDVYIIIGASFPVFALLIALIMFIVYKIKTRKSKIKHLKRKDMQNMAKLTLIKEITEQYRHVLTANPANSQLIIEGWDMIEILLEHKIEDLAVWAAACKFLLRFQLAIGKMDMPIWHMANRYLVIQATKIIERHNWCAETPITIDSPDGLLRTVAIRLIALSLNDKHNPEAHELAWEGIRALGFRAGAQYPHCGALWAVLPHTRPVATVKSTGEEEQFAAVKFRSRMRDLALSKEEKDRIPMPDEDVRPEFGTIAQQAAYALGGSPNSSPVEAFDFMAMVDAIEKDQTTNPTLDLSKNRNNVMKVFDGYVEALTRNPLDKIIDATDKMSMRDATVLERLYHVKPAEEWNALVQKAQVLAHYYGSHMDAMRFQKIFMPEQGTDALKKMVDEQIAFLGAVENELEHLRKWFAKRTDREEFKKKPVYLKNTDKLKLSNAIGKFEAPPKNACSESSKSETDVGKGAQKKPSDAAPAPSGSASASGAGSSGSKSNSGENTPASPAPAAAAAAPATSPATPAKP